MSAARKLTKEELTDTIHTLMERDHIRLRFEMFGGSRVPQTLTTILLNDPANPLFMNMENNQGFAVREVELVPAIETLVREIINNSCDEFNHGRGNVLDVSYNQEKCEVIVRDNGGGIDTVKVTCALTRGMTGSNFGVRKEVVGTNGYGAAIVSNTAAEFEFTTRTRDLIYHQTIYEGDPEIGGEMVIMPPVVSPNKTRSTGTEIRFIPSSYVFKDRILPENYLKTRLFETAVCNPQYKVVFNGEVLRLKSPIEKSLFPNHSSIRIEISDEPTKYRGLFWIVPRFLESGDHYHSVVNNIFTPNGGTHIDPFKRLFPSALLSALERESKRRRLSPNRNDVTETCLVYNITSMQSPDFDSQSKTRLINQTVSQTITKFLEDQEFFKSFIKDNKEWIEEIYRRCADRTQKRDASEISKLSKKLLRNKVPGLLDAASQRRNECILFLAEGDSAIGNMASVRNPDIHGGLALRGKVMNVNGEHPKKVLDNKCLTEIMNSVGLVIGQEAKRHTLRYGKIYIATDMDFDGSNIAALLINFFYTFWPELFNNEQPPFIYVFQTPFVIAEKGSRHRKYWYAHNYHEFAPKDYIGWSITRAKGLGTLTEVDWAVSLDNPVIFPIIEDGKMERSLDLIFNGHRASDRKAWIGL